MGERQKDGIFTSYIICSDMSLFTHRIKRTEWYFLHFFVK